MWKVRHLANSTLLIKNETIFALKAERGGWRLATSFMMKSLIAPGISGNCCAWSPGVMHFKAGTYRYAEGDDRTGDA